MSPSSIKRRIGRFQVEVVQWTSKKCTKSRDTRAEQAPVPGKPISANRGLNIANRRINFIPRLDSVPESTINLNLGIN